MFRLSRQTAKVPRAGLVLLLALLSFGDNYKVRSALGTGAFPVQSDTWIIH